TWAGLRPGTPDGRPILGPDPEVDGLFYATGHFRNGILLAPITARLVADVVAGASPQIPLEPFAPDRFVAEPAR
ncbi:MAG TPA: FAD-dependent oxidoreductase, partial [Nannocystis sp.]